MASTARLPSQLITESRPDFEHIAQILLSFGFLLQERERTKDVCARLALSSRCLPAHGSHSPRAQAEGGAFPRRLFQHIPGSPTFQLTDPQAW